MIKIILFICFMFMVSTANAAQMPNTPINYMNEAAWTTTLGDKVVATEGRIEAMNKSMLSDTMCDLSTVNTTISDATLVRYLNHYKMDYNQYVNGSPMSYAYGKNLVDNALGNKTSVKPAKYGVVIQRSDLRSFPTLTRAFSSLGDTNFDNWQETAVDPGEACLILHYNAKGNFAFVQLQSYRGWLPVNKIAVAKDRETWLKFVKPQSFAVVTDKLFSVNSSGRNWLYQMGTKIPLAGNNLELPIRNQQGYLEVIKTPVNFNSALHKGFLPFTRNNLIKMAFRHLGAPYGWGGLKNSVDCSAFVQDVYKTVGVELPRNGDEQENAFSGVNMKGLSWASRDKVVKSMEPGALFFTPYHVMMYLGEKNGTPYMIHSLGSYGARRSDGGIYKNRVMQVVVSEVYLPGGSGNSLMSQMTKAINYK